VDDNFFVLDGDIIRGSTKIAAFDLDHTIIKTTDPKGKQIFAKNRHDWVFWDTTVDPKLKDLYNDGYKIVIFTNQDGIDKKKVPKSDITGKILDIIKELEIPFQVFVSGSKGIYHKPNSTMWDIMVRDFNNSIKPDMKVSFYCGDAAGRILNWKKGARKDFSCSDRKFAANIGLPFYTPEELFLEENIEATFEWGSVNPLVVCQDPQPLETPQYHSAELEMIIMIGLPASGKSTFTQKYLVPNGYTRVNRDTLGTAAKCIKVAQEALSEGVSVVIDNTNGIPEKRAEFISLAKKMRVPVRCFYFTTSRELAAHLNYVRVRETGGKIKRIPEVAYNNYLKYFQPPSTSEGYSEIIKIEFVPDFRGDVEFERMFKQWT